MYHIRHRQNNIGEFYDGAVFRTLWSSGITPIKLITYDGRPMVPGYARTKLDTSFCDGVEQMHKIGWGR